MARSSSTTIVLVGDNAADRLGELNRYSNVHAASLQHRSDDEAERWLSSSHSPYVVHDRDPLEHLAAAWVEFFDDFATIGTLDLEVDRALTALERGTVSMPDYYIVVDSEDLSLTWKHWWLGVLPQAAPTRVIPWRDGSTSLARVLRGLPTGRAWPKPDPWLRSVARSVPDRIGLEPPASDSPL